MPIGTISIIASASLLASSPITSLFWLDIFHITVDLLSFLGYGFVALIACYIYTRGDMKSVDQTHPDLWRLGIVFLVLSALVRLSSTLQISLRILADIDTIYVTVSCKFLLSIAAILFSYKLYNSRNQFITVSRIWSELDRQSREEGDKQ